LKNVIAVIDVNKDNWNTSFKQQYKEIIKYFYNDTINKLDKIKAFNISQDMNDYINDFTGNKITLISDTTKQDIKYIILKNLEKGNKIDVIETEIRQLYQGFNKSRAETIAITEVAGISNYGSIMGAIEAGAKKKKWIPHFDEKTRISHFNMWRHKPIDLVAFFTVGRSKMQYPGDSNGEAKEVIRCRCVLKFFKK
jgi:hypothetical protein